MDLMYDLRGFELLNWIYSIRENLSKIQTMGKQLDIIFLMIVECVRFEYIIIVICRYVSLIFISTY